ncbi:hypothetical protein ACFVR1_02945 [Psychrobacillus sp. NPDC058041]|uniref:hypothetical protein n=1 Tax=Psychrobacillus sp. NPDC058041 TaxID=3346310 RepID=UPI0036D7B025
MKALPQGRDAFSLLSLSCVPAGSSAHAPAASLSVQKISAIPAEVASNESVAAVMTHRSPRGTHQPETKIRGII